MMVMGQTCFLLGISFDSASAGSAQGSLQRLAQAQPTTRKKTDLPHYRLS